MHWHLVVNAPLGGVGSCLLHSPPTSNYRCPLVAYAFFLCRIRYVRSTAAAKLKDASPNRQSLRHCWGPSLSILPFPKAAYLQESPQLMQHEHTHFPPFVLAMASPSPNSLTKTPICPFPKFSLPSSNPGQIATAKNLPSPLKLKPATLLPYL